LIILIILSQEYKLWSTSLCSFLQPRITSSLFGPNILLYTLFSNSLSLCSFLNVTDQVSHPYKTIGKIIVLYIIIFTFLEADARKKGSGLNSSKHYPSSVSSLFRSVSNFDLLLSFPNVWTVPHFQRLY
jgi:fucose permease